MFQKAKIKNKLKAVFLCLAMGAIAIPSQLVGQERGLTAEDVAKIQSVTSSDISKDGNTIAYTLSKPADPYEENKASSYHLYLYDVENETSVPYFTSSTVRSVEFRPNAQSITFLSYSEEDKKTLLYEIPLKGGAATVLYEYDRSIAHYTWHPNGKSIAFTSTANAEKSISKLPYQAEVFEENRANRKAYILNLEKDELTEIKVEGSVYQLKWSPNGSKLAITASPSPEVDDYYMAQKLKIVDPKTAEVIAEINNEGKIGQIEWSPKADQLAILAGADINDPIDGRILIVPAKGGTPKIIDRDFEGKYEQIKWTSSNSIHFLASEGTSALIGSIQPDGSNKSIIFQSPGYSISSFSISEEKISFVASTPEHPSELFIVDNEKNSKAQRLTFHNTWLDGIALGKQEVVSYAARDGEYQIQGILIYPVDYKKGTAVPTIVVVHGGPESHYDNGWLTAYSMPGQMAAANGYAVFYPNYRGSTGRGIDFAYSSQADMSGKEFDDVVDGVDYLIERGIADKERVGVTGGSYGGYASAWMSTYYSDRFAAAVMFVGISNNLSKWGSSDIPNELYYVHARERIWESDSMWMNYLKRSPIYHVDKAQTPILIMHGENDTRVHPAQSLELYRHIKVRKPEVPVRLVFYPGEGHGNRKASARFDYSLRMMQWFDTYLMSGDSSAEMPSWDVPMPE